MVSAIVLLIYILCLPLLCFEPTNRFRGNPSFSRAKDRNHYTVFKSRLFTIQKIITKGTIRHIPWPGA